MKICPNYFIFFLLFVLNLIEYINEISLNIYNIFTKFFNFDKIMFHNLNLEILLIKMLTLSKYDIKNINAKKFIERKIVL